MSFTLIPEDKQAMTSLKKFPDAYFEFMIVKHTGWTLEYIRNLDYRDYQSISLCVQAVERIQNTKEMVKLRAPSML